MSRLTVGQAFAFTGLAEVAAPAWLQVGWLLAAAAGWWLLGRHDDLPVAGRHTRTTP